MQSLDVELSQIILHAVLRSLVSFVQLILLILLLP
jgi:hypothetical protein